MSADDINGGGNGAQFSASWGASLGAQPAQTGPEPVLDISTAQFMGEVIEASRQRPVVVDFWAPWCGPCKQLAPALERSVAAMRGAVKLVKMNIDDHPEIAGQMGIQSIPAVVAFVDGRPKDAFMGVRPEGEIKRFLEKLAGPSGPSEIEMALEDAGKLAEEGQLEEAANLYAAVLQHEPQNIAAVAGLGGLYLEMGNLEQAKEMLAAVPQDKANDPAIASLRAAIELAEQAASLGDPAPLLKRIADNPKDFEARFDLALIYNAMGQREEAADELLAIVQRDRNWRDDGARAQLLTFFEAWGPTDPASLYGRRRLSSLLFS
ncbi:MAG TPA: thioredoxin [Rhizobiaceae bacterium]|nr:thioredoxin [Rhizobiaceae bacterium]